MDSMISVESMNFHRFHDRFHGRHGFHGICGFYDIHALHDIIPILIRLSLSPLQGGPSSLPLMKPQQLAKARVPRLDILEDLNQ